MRPSSLLVLLLMACGLASRAHPDSWFPPAPQQVMSEDGRWYVIVQTTEGYENPTFQLVRRAAGKPPPPPPPAYDRYMEKPPVLKPEPGDEVVARGPCKIPMGVKCLDGGKGFVLFDTYGRVGDGTVLEVYDGTGKRRWSRTLADLFEPEIRATFRRSASSTWWSETMWVDEPRQEIVIVWRGSGAPQVVRLALADGRWRQGAHADLLTRIGRGSGGEQVAALDLATKLALPGLLPAVQQAFAEARTPPWARVHFAKFLDEAGDPAGRGYLAAAAQEGMPGDVRAFALKYVPAVLGLEALPTLREAMRSEDYALWNMPVEDTLAAREALEKAAKSKHGKLAYAAKQALKQILEHLGEEPSGSK